MSNHSGAGSSKRVSPPPFDKNPVMPKRKSAPGSLTTTSLPLDSMKKFALIRIILKKLEEAYGLDWLIETLNEDYGDLILERRGRG